MYPIFLHGFRRSRRQGFVFVTRWRQALGDDKSRLKTLMAIRLNSSNLLNERIGIRVESIRNMEADGPLSRLDYGTRCPVFSKTRERARRRCKDARCEHDQDVAIHSLRR